MANDRFEYQQRRRSGGEPLERVAIEGLYSRVESWRGRQIYLAGGSRERLHAWQFYRPSFPCRAKETQWAKHCAG